MSNIKYFPHVVLIILFASVSSEVSRADTHSIFNPSEYQLIASASEFGDSMQGQLYCINVVSIKNMDTVAIIFYRDQYNNKLIAKSLKTNKILWAVGVPGEYERAAAFDFGTFVEGASDDGYYYMIFVDSQGNIKWKQPSLGNSIFSSNGQYWASGGYSEGDDGKNTVKIFDRNGVEKYRFRPKSPVHEWYYNLLDDGGMVIVTWNNNNQVFLKKLSVKGNFLWEQPISFEIDKFTHLILPRLSYITLKVSSDGNIMAVACYVNSKTTFDTPPKNDRELFVFGQDGMPLFRKVISRLRTFSIDKDRIYVKTSVPEEGLIALDANKGDILWTNKSVPDLRYDLKLFSAKEYLLLSGDMSFGKHPLTHNTFVRKQDGTIIKTIHNQDGIYGSMSSDGKCYIVLNNFFIRFKNIYLKGIEGF